MLDGKILEYQEAMKKVKDLESHRAKVGIKDNRLASDLHKNVKARLSFFKKAVDELRNSAIKLEEQKKIFQKKLEVSKFGTLNRDSRTFTALPQEYQNILIESQKKSLERFNRKLKGVYDKNLKDLAPLVDDYEHKRGVAMNMGASQGANKSFMEARYKRLDDFLKAKDIEFRQEAKRLQKVRDNIEKSKDEIERLGRFNQFQLDSRA